MALRDQPYLPLYVQDYLTDEKLNMCSWSTQGVYIKILCVLHKSEPYGTILLKQKEKQTKNGAYNFALKLAKILPIDKDKLYEAIQELIEEGCLILDKDNLYQKRMVRDNDISIKRALAGKKGGKLTQVFAKAKAQANTEDVNENEDIIKDDNKINIEFEEFWNLYDKKRGNKEKLEGKWNKLSNDDRISIMDYIPKYKDSQPDKTFRKDPETFLNNKSWNDEIISKPKPFGIEDKERKYDDPEAKF